jgi:hypothetical protein
MGLPAKKTLKIFSMTDISGGLNINDPPVSIADDQVQEVLNGHILKKGFKRWCGCKALSDEGQFNANHLGGIFSHVDLSGNNYLYVVNGNLVYSVNTQTGVATHLGAMNSQTLEAWGTSHWGKFYFTNGVNVYKLEGSVLSQVGITPPAATATSAAVAGGTLGAGVYKIKIGYARKVNGLTVLYSQGTDLANVTLSGGNGSIRITNFPNSSDSQGNDKVVWMTLPNGAIYFNYVETGDNTTTTINITSDTSNAFIPYDTFAQDNCLPGAFTFIFAFSNRLWGVIGNKLYYSLKAETTYDLEVFPAENYIEYPYQIIGLFSIGQDLCINTAQNGILIQPSADVGAAYLTADPFESFWNMRTVADWNGGKIGLTNKGIFWFNPTTYKFDPFDYGYNIRPALQKIWQHATTDLYPCGFTYRRENRIEYHLSFCDTDVGNTNNNRTYVLNLSQTVFSDNQSFKTPWEVISRGFNFAAVDTSNNIFFAHNSVGVGWVSKCMFVEDWASTQNQGCFNETGHYIDSGTDMPLIVKSKVMMQDLYHKIIIEEARALLQIAATATLSFNVFDDPSKILTQNSSVSQVGESRWDEAVFDESVFSTESQKVWAPKGKLGMFGYSMYFVFSQIGNDINFLLTQIDVLTTLESGNGI